MTATDPDSATQDTTLDVAVSGSGFDQGSHAQWAIDGIPSTKVRTNSTRFVTPKKLIANITIAPVVTVRGDHVERQRLGARLAAVPTSLTQSFSS